MKNAGKILVGAMFVMSGCALFSACGSTAPSTDDDGGTDGAAKETSALDTSVPDVQTSMDSATCDLSSDLTNNIPDAALDDSGTRSTGLCLACANTASTCKMNIDACNADCDCKGAVGDVLVCIAKGGGQACLLMAASLPDNARTIGTALLGCVNKYCSKECTPAGLMDAGGSTDAAGDGSDAN